MNMIHFVFSTKKIFAFIKERILSIENSILTSFLQTAQAFGYFSELFLTFSHFHFFFGPKSEL